jgi:hypothetical protein
MGGYTPTSAGFSCAAWLKPDTGWGNSTSSKIIHYGSSTLSIDNTNGKVSFTVYNTIPDPFSATYNTPLTVGTWYFVGGSFDPTDKLPRIYLNASLVATGTTPLTGTNLNESASTKSIGGVSASNRQIKGTVGEGFMYNRTLNVLEFQHIFQLTKWRYS